MATGKRRDKAQVARDRLRISDLYLQGWIQADIAEKVGLSQATVSRDIKALQQEWLDQAGANFDAAKAQELAKIDRLEREYWRAWLRSCEDAETEATKAVETEDGKPQRYEASSQRKRQAGDPRFLNGVQWCIEQRCKILGVYAPEEIKGNIVMTYAGNTNPDEL
jgi:transposase